jgi:hypothetical protein
MCDKTMENYKPNMFQLQCLKALEIQIEEGKGYNEAEIGKQINNLPMLQKIPRRMIPGR